MGTNFYFYTRNKAVARMMGPHAESTDRHKEAWELHIAKTSCGGSLYLRSTSTFTAFVTLTDFIMTTCAT